MGSVARTSAALFNKEPLISVNAYEFNAFGNVDDSTNLNAAVTAANGRRIDLAPGIHTIKSPIIVPSGGMYLKGVPGSTVLREDALSYLISAIGSIDTASSIDLDSDAAAGDIAVTVATGKGALLPVGWHLVVSEALITGSTQKTAEWVYVEDVDVDTINLAGPLRFAYLTSDAAQFFPASLIENITIENVIFESSDTENFGRLFCNFIYCLRPRLINCTFRNGRSAGASFIGTVGAEMISCRAENLLSDSGAPGAFGYFAYLGSANRGFKMLNCSSERVRHHYTDGASVGYGYGVAMDVTVDGGTCLYPRQAGLDTHPGTSWGVHFANFTIAGGRHEGIQARASHLLVTNVVVRDCVGPALRDVSTARNTVTRGLTAIQTNQGIDSNAIDWRERGAIDCDGSGSRHEAFSIENCGGVGIKIGGADVIIGRGAIINPCRLNAALFPASGCPSAGIWSTVNTVTTININGAIIRCSDTRMDYGVYQAGSGVTLDFTCIGVDCKNQQVQTIYYEAATINKILANGGPNALGIAKGASFTIASGVVDISNHKGGIVSLAGEGGVADNLDTITGGADGDYVELRCVGGYTITVKHATGNIRTSGSDVSLASSNSLVGFRRFGANWHRIGS